MLTLTPAARAGVALAGLLIVGMLAVLVSVLISLESTRSEIRTTRAGVVDADQRLQRASRNLRPLLDAVQPLTGGDTRRRVRHTTTALAAAVDRLPEVARRAGEGIDAATFIASTLDRAGLEQALSSVRSLADATRTAAQPGARSLDACDASLRSRPPGARGQIGCLLRTVPNIRALLRSQRRLNRKSTRTQVTQLSVTQRTFQLISESLAIQRELLEHARSLDRKTGGTAPTTPLGPG